MLPPPQCDYLTVKLNGMMAQILWVFKISASYTINYVFVWPVKALLYEWRFETFHYFTTETYLKKSTFWKVTVYLSKDIVSYVYLAISTKEPKVSNMTIFRAMWSNVRLEPCRNNDPSIRKSDVKPNCRYSWTHSRDAFSILPLIEWF